MMQFYLSHVGSQARAEAETGAGAARVIILCGGHAVQSFPGKEKVHLSVDRLAQDENEGAYPTELLNSMNPPGFG
jgi:hypothetical protein